MTDTLERAARELAQLGDGEPQGSRGTRARIMDSQHETRRRRRTGWAFGIPLAAIFVGSTAWAGASGKLPELVRAWAPSLLDSSSKDVGEVAKPPRRASPPQRGTSRASTDVAEPVAPQPESTDELVTPEAEPAHDPPSTQQLEAATKVLDHPPSSRRSVRQASPLPSTQRTTHEPVTAPDPHLALYRKAHRAHFSEDDPSAALAGYDEYLRAAPRGRFATEAAYNRGLCLVRLGRHAEAKRALKPFADGRYGGYREDAARALIVELGGSAALPNTSNRKARDSSGSSTPRR